MPASNPAAETPTTVGAELLHKPPGDALASGCVAPIHTVGVPVIGLTDGTVLTVTTTNAAEVPHVLVTVYDMVVVPVVTLDTTPVPDMVATAGVVLLHTPPGVASDKGIVPPRHSGPTPAIGATTGTAFTVAM